MTADEGIALGWLRQARDLRQRRLEIPEHLADRLREFPLVDLPDWMQAEARRLLFVGEA